MANLRGPAALLVQRRHGALALVAVLGLALSGCATMGPATGASRDALTEVDLAEFANMSCYDAVRRLRPMWLQSRTARARPIVVIDGTPRGQVEILRSFRAIDFSLIEHLEGPEATTRFGTGYAGGALVLSSKRASERLIESR